MQRFLVWFSHNPEEKLHTEKTPNLNYAREAPQLILYTLLSKVLLVSTVNI